MDKSGSVKAPQLQTILRLSGFELNDQEHYAIFKNFDPENSGMIKYNTFLNVVYGPKSYAKLHEKIFLIYIQTL